MHKATNAEQAADKPIPHEILETLARDGMGGLTVSEYMLHAERSDPARPARELARRKTLDSCYAIRAIADVLLEMDGAGSGLENLDQGTVMALMIQVKEHVDRIRGHISPG